MYKKIIKVATGVLLSLSLAVAGFGMTANALEPPKPTTAPNPLNAGGRISKDQSGAKATTTLSRPGFIRAKAIAYYKLGEKRYRSEAVKTNNIGGTTAFAEKKVDDANVVGAAGEHSASYEKTTWNDDTHIGEILTNTILK